VIDVVRILSSNGVHFVTEGKNTKRGNVNVKCPFCGNDDPSEHMGIELSTAKWGCWRNNSHRGKNFAFLLKELLGISFKDAARIVGFDKPRYEESSLESLARGDYFADDSVEEKRTSNKLTLKHFKKFAERPRSASGSFVAQERFDSYIYQRGLRHTICFRLRNATGCGTHLQASTKTE